VDVYKNKLNPSVVTEQSPYFSIAPQLVELANLKSVRARIGDKIVMVI
jgi:hypothetical protein